MRPFLVRPVDKIKGKLTLPGDKSISHRALILSAISEGKSEIINFAGNEDCLATLKALKGLGVKSAYLKGLNKVRIGSGGLYALRRPKKRIFCAESGTTFRLLLGILAGQDFTSTLSAGKSLSRRPMRRVAEPLRKMGAKIISGRGGLSRFDAEEEYPPLTVSGGNLSPVTYKMPLASAQVKSAVLLAGLYAFGRSKVIEPLITRDHTERMLKFFNARIKKEGETISIEGKRQLVSPGRIYIPGDISSAVFFAVAALILAQSEITVLGVGVNPSRIGALKVLKRMGAKIKIKAVSQPYSGRRLKKRPAGYEPLGDIIVKSSRLKGALIREREVPSLIDELPVLMVAACFASGRTVFKSVGELRVKETDRINSMSANLKKMGALIFSRKRFGKEDLIIQGVPALYGAKVRSFSDHRTAMSMIVAGLAARGNTSLDDISCISKSFPDFINKLKSLIV